MKAITKFCAILFSVGALAQAATTSTMLTVNATGSLSLSGATATGTATMPGVYTGSGAFSGSLPLSLSGQNVVGSFTITPSTGNTLSGTITLPLALLESILAQSGSTASGSGSMTVTGGTGSFSGYTGSFPNVSGSGTATANGGFTLTLTGAGTISTTGGGTVTPTPTITAVQDDAGYTANIAEGSLFVVKGTNLAASGYTSLAPPYPTSSGGVQIVFTPVATGAPISTYLFYLYNENGVSQLGGILPSTVAAGNYNVTVTYNNVASAPFAATVVQHKPSLYTQDTTGSGLVVVQNYVSASESDIDRFTTGVVNQTFVSPAKPGQTLIAWGTGLGPITAPDNQPTTFNFLPGLNVQVIVGGVSITPSFAGLSGYPGEDQINFVLPANIPTGCTVSFQVSVNGVLSNPTFLSIAPNSSANACVAPGLTTAQLQNLDNGGMLTGGGFQLEQFSGSLTESGTSVSEQVAMVSGSFTQVTGFQLASSPVVTSQPGVCQVAQSTSSTQTGIVTPSGGTNLDAGAIALTGPSGSNITNAPLTETSNSYSLTISEQLTPPISGAPLSGIPNASIVAGTYSLKGAGGKDVGPFNASITLGTPLTITGGLPSTVNRSAGLTLNWTGGNSTDTVEIFGSSGTSGSTTGFLCVTTAGPGTFTVPASILDQLPAATASAISAGTGSGFLGVFSSPSPASGNGLIPSITLTAGGSITDATFLALLGITSSPTYQ